jgi:hypothetical protein
MLNTLDTVIAFAVIMTVLSLLITLVVQMVSATLSLRGKNLANALALTFQTIDPSIGKYAHSLAAQILRDPIFSDSLWQHKTRRSLDENAQRFIAAQRKLRDARMRRPDDPNRAEAISKATAEVDATKAALTVLVDKQLGIPNNWPKVKRSRSTENPGTSSPLFRRRTIKRQNAIATAQW